MNDDLTLLASAYLDGEATPDERARVEADAALLVEVERLRTARMALLDVSGSNQPRTTCARPRSPPPSTPGTAPRRRRTPRSEHAPRTDIVRPALRATPLVDPLAHGSGSRGRGRGARCGHRPAGWQRRRAVRLRSRHRPRPPLAPTASSRIDGTARAAGASGADALLSDDVAADEAGGADPDASAPAEAPTAGGGRDSCARRCGGRLGFHPRRRWRTSRRSTTWRRSRSTPSGPSTARHNGMYPSRRAGPRCLPASRVRRYRHLPRRNVVIGIDDDHVSAIDPDSCEIVAEASLPDPASVAPHAGQPADRPELGTRSRRHRRTRRRQHPPEDHRQRGQGRPAHRVRSARRDPRAHGVDPARRSSSRVRCRRCSTSPSHPLAPST